MSAPMSIEGAAGASTGGAACWAVCSHAAGRPGLVQPSRATLACTWCMCGHCQCSSMLQGEQGSHRPNPNPNPNPKQGSHRLPRLPACHSFPCASATESSPLWPAGRGSGVMITACPTHVYKHTPTRQPVYRHTTTVSTIIITIFALMFILNGWGQAKPHGGDGWWRADGTPSLSCNVLYICTHRWRPAGGTSSLSCTLQHVHIHTQVGSLRTSIAHAHHEQLLLAIMLLAIMVSPNRPNMIQAGPPQAFYVLPLITSRCWFHPPLDCTLQLIDLPHTPVARCTQMSPDGQASRVCDELNSSNNSLPPHDPCIVALPFPFLALYMHVGATSPSPRRGLRWSSHRSAPLRCRAEARWHIFMD